EARIQGQRILDLGRCLCPPASIRVIFEGLFRVGRSEGRVARSKLGVERHRPLEERYGTVLHDPFELVEVVLAAQERVVGLEVGRGRRPSLAGSRRPQSYSKRADDVARYVVL